MGGRLVYVDMWAGDLVHERKLAGIRRYAEMRGWSVCTLGDAESRPARLAATLARLKPIGCIVESSSGHRDLPPRVFRGFPAVYLDGPANLYGGHTSCCVHDGTATVREAFRELSSNRPCAYGIVGHAAAYFWSRKRIGDFRSLAARTDRPCHVFPDSSPADAATRTKRLVEWVASLPQRTALFAVNDVVALEVLAACNAANRRVPTDLTLVGVDNRERLCESAEPKISSVQIDFERAGYRAAKLVDRLVAGRGVLRESFGPLMVVRRESTRGFGRREPRMLAAIDLIRREACNGLRASEVARQFKGSRRLVDIRFREAFGHSILDEIQNVRFEKVCVLLSRTETAVSAIAGLCGFGSEVTLRSQFRKRMGMSMSAWRRVNAARD